MLHGKGLSPSNIGGCKQELLFSFLFFVHSSLFFISTALTQFKDDMLTMMEINTSALQLRDLDCAIDVLREEEFVIV